MLSENIPTHAGELPRRLQVLSTRIGGAGVTCGLALGKVAAGGAGRFVASLVIGLTPLVAVAVLVALGPSNRRSSVRGVAVFTGALALAVAVMRGAAALSRG